MTLIKSLTGRLIAWPVAWSIRTEYLIGWLEGWFLVGWSVILTLGLVGWSVGRLIAPVSLSAARLVNLLLVSLMTKNHVKVDVKKVSILKRLSFLDLQLLWLIFRLQNDVLLSLFFYLYLVSLNTYKHNFVYLFFVITIFYVLKLFLKLHDFLARSISELSKHHSILLFTIFPWYCLQKKKREHSKSIEDFPLR